MKEKMRVLKKKWMDGWGRKVDGCDVNYFRCSF